MPKLEATQTNRSIVVTSPLGEDVLLFHSMNVNEQLGRLFQFGLDLLSEDPEIKLQDILAQNVTVRYLRPDGEYRYFNGFVSQFSQAGSHGNLFIYRATLRPWFWFLTRTADCRIFQHKTVPDIIKEVFRDKGFSDFEDALSGNYHEWENCVQYRETDFNFISRLMEQEGMYYFFKHEDGKHTLVLSDSISAHETVPGYEDVPYYPPEESERRERDHIFDWSLNQIIQPGAYVLNDYDFKKPKANLEVKSSVSREHDQAEFEIYDYPGEYKESGDGEGYVRARIEELQSQHEEVHGEGNVAGLMTGCLFKLINYPREDQNREYLITSASYNLGPQEYESNVGGGGSGSIFSCNFSAIDKQQAFRARRITDKPIVQGPQTATVVGKGGEEIWTDEYGRVKVQFHWDRYGEDNENSSCWIRVSHPWAGKNWGAVAIPRIGQEVIVSFIEGDPDQPIITGRVYNDDNMHPYELPANATQSGVKTRSSKGGSPDNFNELRFEDKKGEEQLYIHAEKNQDNIVENDETTSVGHDRTEDVGNDETITIGNDRTESVGNNETITIGNDRTETVGNNETITIGVDRTESVGSNETVTIGSNRSVTIGSNKSETISINKAETIGAAKELTIGGLYQVTVGGAMNETVALAKAQEVGAAKATVVGGNVSETYGSSQTTDVSKDHNETIGENQTIKIGKNLTIDAGDQVVIKTGKASITMKKDGTISIEGKDITIKGSGAINVKASKDIVMKGKKILQN
jgi:type VI secretion system secreted protein VgrG